MMQAVAVHRSGRLRDVPAEEHLAAIADIARKEGLAELTAALRQRYPGTVT
jgi:hypothetical protein